jgi:hypothetical protein
MFSPIATILLFTEIAVRVLSPSRLSQVHWYV